MADIDPNLFTLRDMGHDATLVTVQFNPMPSEHALIFLGTLLDFLAQNQKLAYLIEEARNEMMYAASSIFEQREIDAKIAEELGIDWTNLQDIKIQAVIELSHLERLEQNTAIDTVTLG